MIFTGPITPVLSSVDGWNAEILANAVRFKATLFMGSNQYETLEADTAEQIHDAAQLLKDEHPDNKRPVMIYAYDAAGNETLVSPVKKPKEPKPAKAKAPKAEKPAKAPKAPKPPKEAAPAKAPGGKRGEILAAAERGVLPDAPDFSANTHKPFRKKLEQLVALVKAGDVAGLEAFAINPISTSPKALDRYRNLAVTALKAKAAKKAAKAEKEAVTAPEAE